MRDMRRWLATLLVILVSCPPHHHAIPEASTCSADTGACEALPGAPALLGASDDGNEDVWVLKHRLRLLEAEFHAIKSEIAALKELITTAGDTGAARAVHD